MQDMPEYLSYLYQAMASDKGIVVAFSNVQLGQAKLYRARALSGDPDLKILQIRPSPVSPDEEIWIIKGAENGTQVGTTEGTEARTPDGGGVGGT